MAHQHHPECKHLHQHSPDCSHGTPTAIPAHGLCPVCGADELSQWCEAHRQWECHRHPKIGAHHGRSDE